MYTAPKQIEATFMLQELLAFTDAYRAWQSSVRCTLDENLNDARGVKHFDLEDQLLPEIIARRARNESYFAIAIELNRRGVRGGYGARWYASSVSLLLRRALSKTPDIACLGVFSS